MEGVDDVLLLLHDVRCDGDGRVVAAPGRELEHGGTHAKLRSEQVGCFLWMILRPRIRLLEFAKQRADDFRVGLDELRPRQVERATLGRFASESFTLTLFPWLPRER
ncbi:hypothetical protein [Paraburkholderia oxyphila]|uniref:hypothetical protein n=1 Tax=Paraburkholderia oxyphila TaxID=614212 RepID=UPI0004801808|nr:hypothetical protein [Paraburkholderia oxyphila]